MSVLEQSPVEATIDEAHQTNIYEVLQDDSKAINNEEVAEYESSDEESEDKKALDKSLADLDKLVKIFFIPFVAGIIGRRLAGMVYRYFTRPWESVIPVIGVPT